MGYGESKQTDMNTDGRRYERGLLSICTMKDGSKLDTLDALEHVFHISILLLHDLRCNQGVSLTNYPNFLRGQSQDNCFLHFIGMIRCRILFYFLSFPFS